MFVVLQLFLIKIAVTAGFRSSICLRENERFSLCGWKCPPSCVNMRLVEKGRQCPSVWECRVGCRCAPGYIRDEYSKGCILVNQCPISDKCPPGEIMGVDLQCLIRNRSVIRTNANKTRSPWDYYD